MSGGGGRGRLAVLFSPPVAGREITNKQQKHWLSQKLQFRVILSSFLGLKAQEVRHVSSETAFNPLRGAIARDLFHFLCIQAPESKTACSESLGFCVWEAKSETRIKRNGPRVWGGGRLAFFFSPWLPAEKVLKQKKDYLFDQIGCRVECPQKNRFADAFLFRRFERFGL